MGEHHNTTKVFLTELTGSALYGVRTHLERARHSGFHALDVEHRTDSRRPLDRPPGTTTETDEDKDRLTLGTSEVAAPLQLTTHQNDEDGTYYFSHATR